MSNGPQLVNGRDRFACGTFESGAKTMAIVAGGFDGKSSVSTEIWDPMSENGWVAGKIDIIFYLRKEFFCQRTIQMNVYIFFL